MANGDKKEPVSISLDSTTIFILDSVAQNDMTSRSAIVEKALWEYYGRRFTTTPKFRSLISNHVASVSQGD